MLKNLVVWCLKTVASNTYLLALNSIHSKYISILEAEITKKDIFIEKILGGEPDVEERTKILNFVNSKKNQGAFIDCDFRINGFRLYKVDAREFGCRHGYYLRNIVTDESYVFHGRSGYIKCVSNDSYVDLDFHPNHAVFKKTLAKIPEIMTGGD